MRQVVSQSRIHIIAILFVGLMTVVPAYSQSIAEGQQAIDLMRDCQGRGSNYDAAVQSNMPDPKFFGNYDVLICIGYIAGISDLNALNRGVFGRSFFCFPGAGLSAEQQVLVVVKWMRDHPEQLHESRRMAVVGAFAQAFPCE